MEGKWIRLRTNGKDSTLTYKDIVSDKIDGTKEIEIEVSDFDKTNFFLNKIGFRAKAYQENNRILYKCEEVEIAIDSWPLIPTYIEIEGKKQEDVYNMLEKLDLEKEKVTTKNVQAIYESYGIVLDSIKELKF